MEEFENSRKFVVSGFELCGLHCSRFGTCIGYLLSQIFQEKWREAVINHKLQNERIIKCVHEIMSTIAQVKCRAKDEQMKQAHSMHSSYRYTLPLILIVQPSQTWTIHLLRRIWCQ